MRVFYLFCALLMNVAMAQQEYFNPTNKADGLKYFQNKIYLGCRSLKDKQIPVSQTEAGRLAAKTIKIVSQSYKKAFAENPKIKESFYKDMASIARDPFCQTTKNNCRALMLANAMYYYQKLRPDIRGCEKDNTSNQLCTFEQSYWERTLVGVQGSNYGTSPAGMYKHELIRLKNDTTLDLFKALMYERDDVIICNQVESGSQYEYNLDMNDPGSYFSNIDPNYDPYKNLPQECNEEKVTLYGEFFPTSFGSDRSTISIDELNPLKEKLTNFIHNETGIIITDVEVTASTSSIPFYKVSGTKKVLDPDSTDKNLNLVRERANFAHKVIKEVQSSSSQLKEVNFKVTAEMAGPEFRPQDLNDRFITRMTPGYLQKVESLYKRYQSDFENRALTKSVEDLLDDKKYTNLFEAKFKPFQGFRLLVKGFKRDNMKCLDLGSTTKPAPKKTTKQ